MYNNNTDNNNTEPSSIWQVWQLYGGRSFSLHTLSFGTLPYGQSFDCCVCHDFFV